MVSLVLFYWLSINAFAFYFIIKGTKAQRTHKDDLADSQSNVLIIKLRILTAETQSSQRREIYLIISSNSRLRSFVLRELCASAVLFP